MRFKNYMMETLLESLADKITYSKGEPKDKEVYFLIKGEGSLPVKPDADVDYVLMRLSELLDASKDDIKKDKKIVTMVKKAIEDVKNKGK